MSFQLTHVPPSLFLLEHPDKPLIRNQGENWLEAMLFGRLINRCLMTIPSIKVLCKETTSIVTRSDLNAHHTTTGPRHYLRPSPRLDVMFRLNRPAYEVDGCGVVPNECWLEDTKRIDDNTRLVSTLSHMLGRLHRVVYVSEPERMEVVGLLCSGLSMQTLRMHSPNGYTFFLRRGALRRIPVNEGRIRDVRALLREMLVVRNTISETVEVLWSASGKKGE
jgi:hypothetical protein